ncbi:HNH endonuclease [[Limnothrix rosea] IAM M-220]|uniref:HNH endonuclease n=1 Tax=[Limnothrix rosea] IAM M-220 TaxID=454133 RepID=UPI00095F34B5|nr:HNH endonuclease signature motif containing protein [[Limnothrix rosea] IAM M-220]OKH18567.1 HNH endonuclease [[Limnothrix rosea] IAM M-220]
MPLDKELRQTVRERADYLCEYCHSPEKLSASRFTIDHLIPRSLGGTDDLENLALACRRCNERRYNFVAGVDPKNKEITPIYQPRLYQWSDHFCWENQGALIRGVLNDERYPAEDSIQATRKLWIAAGWHPPQNDPCAD